MGIRLLFQCIPASETQCIPETAFTCNPTSSDGGLGRPGVSLRDCQGGAAAAEGEEGGELPGKKDWQVEGRGNRCKRNFF